MRMWHTPIWAASVLLLMACGGGSSPQNKPPNPQNKTYGIFKPLVAKSASSKQQLVNNQAVLIPSVNISPRANHRAIQMLNGKVLLVGGDVYASPAGNNIPTMDIFDPATQTFTRSSATPHATLYYQLGSGSSEYSSFALVNLPNNKVWIGGANKLNNPEAYSYDIYDCDTDAITNTEVITEGVENAYPQVGPCDEAYYIGNNKILLFLSLGSQAVLDLTTSTVSWIVNDLLQGIGSLSNTSTIQDASGNVYQIGGNLPPNSNITDPIGGSYATIFKFDTSTSSWVRLHNLITPREGANVVLLSDNKIGIYGGRRVADGRSVSLTSVEIYDITTDSITSSVDLIGARSKAASVYLQTGYTLISGGIGFNGVESSELVHKADINFSGSTGQMTMPRLGHTTTSLPNGLVLIAGGYPAESNTTAELFDPQTALYLSYTSEQLILGNTMPFAAKNAAGSEVSVTWSSNNEAVATISSTGVLTSMSEGIVEIKATLTSDTAVVAVVRIYVLPQ